MGCKDIENIIQKGACAGSKKDQATKKLRLESEGVGVFATKNDQSIVQNHVDAQFILISSSVALHFFNDCVESFNHHILCYNDIS